jgi:glycosyltransferase involved in cell wall biosynthesis
MNNDLAAGEAPYPPIPAVTPGLTRPFWSIMIPTYNCAHYLQATLASVLPQIPRDDAVQIEVLDDGSTRDDPAAVVAACGEGRVGFFRQPANVGPPDNFPTCIKRARGHWIHILHGDDMVAPGFYRAWEAAAAADATIGAAFCRTINVDREGARIDLSDPEAAQAGILPNLIGRLAIENRIMFPSIVVKRSTYEQVGGFHRSLFHSADWDMWKRVALAVPVWYDPTPLAMYRLHPQSDTSYLMRTGANIADARHAIEIARSYLPAGDREALTQRAMQHHGLYAMELAVQMIDRRAWASARAQVREAFRCSTSLPILRAALQVACHAAIAPLSPRRPVTP